MNIQNSTPISTYESFLIKFIIYELITKEAQNKQIEL